jgi:Trypsin
MTPHPIVRTIVAAALLGALAPAQAISNGSNSSGFAHVGVGGVQVAPDWVFTAQHLAPGVGITFTNSYGSRTVAAVYTAPASTGFPAHDFALMRLAPAATSAPLLPVNGTLVPYGQFAPWDVTMASALSAVPGQRTYGWSTISESLLTYTDTSVNPPVTSTVNWLMSNDTRVYVQGGDSGSGLFAGHVTDSSVLMGIASAQITDDAGVVPLGSAFVQPAAYRSWIDATLLADPFDNNAVLWTSVSVPVPEAGTWALWGLGLGLGLLAARRRRRRAPPRA